MNITISTPSLAAVGSADDADPATGAACSYSGPGNGRCADGFSASSASPTTATSITASAQAVIGPAPAASANANAKGEANSSVTITYSFWEKLFALFGVKQQLSAAVNLTVSALVRSGPNQITFAVFLLGGPSGSTNPIPVYQGNYNFDQSAADPNILDVKKNGAVTANIPNPGLYNDLSRGPAADVLPGTYDLKYEMNAVATADGQVTVTALGNLRLFEV